jgi:hypothetical protein
MEPLPKRRKLSSYSINASNDLDVNVKDEDHSMAKSTKSASLPTPASSQNLLTPSSSQNLSTPAPSPKASLLTLPNELLQRIFYHSISTPPPCSPDELRDVSTIHALVRVSSLVQANVVSAVRLYGDTSMRINVRFAVYEWIADEGRRRGWSWERGLREGMARVRGLGMD